MQASSPYEECGRPHWMPESCTLGFMGGAWKRATRSITGAPPTEKAGQQLMIEVGRVDQRAARGIKLGHKGMLLFEPGKEPSPGAWLWSGSNGSSSPAGAAHRGSPPGCGWRRKRQSRRLARPDSCARPRPNPSCPRCTYIHRARSKSTRSYALC